MHFYLGYVLLINFIRISLLLTDLTIEISVGEHKSVDQLRNRFGKCTSSFITFDSNFVGVRNDRPFDMEYIEIINTILVVTKFV